MIDNSNSITSENTNSELVSTFTIICQNCSELNGKKYNSRQAADLAVNDHILKHPKHFAHVVTIMNG